MQGISLIFVVGEAGSGKTTLLGEITDQELGVGHSHKSGMYACPQKKMLGNRVTEIRDNRDSWS